MYLILKLLARKIGCIRFREIFGVFVLHAVLSYLGFWAIGETDLVASPVSFAYYYTVTASTIGYGDMSPSTPLGQFFATIFLIPIAISIFATLITKAVSTMTNELSKIKNGLGDFSREKGHIVVVGCIPHKTDRLIREIEDKNVIVVTTGHRPTNDRIHHVLTQSLASAADLKRAGILTASKVVVMGSDDAETLKASLAASNVAPKSTHIVAYLDSQETADLLEATCPTVETVTDNSVAQLARSLDDPGASHVISNLVSNEDPVSLRSIVMTPGAHFMGNMWEARYISDYFRFHFSATLVGFGTKEKASLSIEPGDIIKTGDVIYYIANKDIDIWENPRYV